MSISDTDFISKKAFGTAMIYLMIALFTVLFGAVYELFSHGVYSFYMIYAFVFPLAGGTFPFLALAALRKKRYPRAFARHLYHSGIATLTVGYIVQGVLEIYGTTNALTRVYWIAGAFLLMVSVISYVLRRD